LPEPNTGAGLNRFDYITGSSRALTRKHHGKDHGRAYWTGRGPGADYLIEVDIFIVSSAGRSPDTENAQSPLRHLSVVKDPATLPLPGSGLLTCMNPGIPLISTAEPCEISPVYSKSPASNRHWLMVKLYLPAR
jgi:hypothetical protein